MSDTSANHNSKKDTLILFSANSNSDRIFATELAEELRKVGRSVTLGTQESSQPLPGNEHPSAPTGTSVVVACLSSDAISDSKLQSQLSTASQDNDKLVVALILDPGVEISPQLRSSNPEILVWHDFENTFSQLLRVLNGKRKDVVSDDPQTSSGPLSSVNAQTLRDAAQHAASKLDEIARSTGEEANRLSNEEALIGHLPQWHHLFMGAYGAFARPEKEKQILAEVDRCLEKLNYKASGCVLHVVSGDSGCGKSTLAKQVIRRLIERDVPVAFKNISATSGKLQFFEVTPLAMKSALAQMQENQATAAAPYMFFYVDDLFALDDREINDMLRTITEISEKTPVYLFATSPSWLFDRKDLQEKKRTFQLLESVETRIGGIDRDDREALKRQYLEMHKEDFRAELLKQIDQAGDELILFKIALHHNLSYSEYFDQLFRRLEERQPKRLAALLLFSTLARFYVHFPVHLIKELNRPLNLNDRLWESEYDYETTNDAGLRLFRYRRGNRSAAHPTGTPDTVAPFHDRVAQIIYSTWGENRKLVPIFNCTLRDLRNRVYQLLDADSEGQVVLSRLFRGHVRVAGNKELASFVKHFGPVRGGAWRLANVPVAAYLWISYSKYRPDRTAQFRQNWESALLSDMRTSTHEALYLTLILLNPSRLSEPQFRNKLADLKLEKLDTSFFFILRGVLDALLGRFPLQIEALGDYLLRLAEWLDARSGDDRSSPNRYYVVASLASNSAKIFSRFRSQQRINTALSQLIKGYLLNLELENATNDLLGVRGLLQLVNRIEWAKADAVEISVGLMKYLRGSNYRFKSVLFEHLVHFRLLAQNYEIGDVFETFLTICREDPAFRGHTYIPDALWSFVSQAGAHRPEERHTLLNRVLSDFSDGKLRFLETGTVYPDFLGGLIDQLVVTGTEGSTDALFAMFGPLVEKFPNHLEVPYVFIKAGKLHDSFIDSLSETTTDVTRRQIRLCFAKRLDIGLESVLNEFVDLLTGDNISAPYAILAILSYYLRGKDVKEVPLEILNDQRRRFYGWLREHREGGKAAPYISLVETTAFYSESEFEDLWDLVAQNIELIPRRIHPRFFPFAYIKWWLAKPARLEKNREATRAILDACWTFILQNADVQYKNRFVCYHEHFMVLFTRYPIGADEVWWGKAVARLTEFLSTLLERGVRQGRRQQKARELSAEYRTQLCLQLILEAIRKQFDHQRLQLKGEFESAVGIAFDRHKHEAWAAEWTLTLRRCEDLDGTAMLITYWDSLEVESINAFNARNEAHWWYDWLCNSTRDPGVEINRLSQWLERAPSKSLVAYLLLDILDITRNASAKISWGPLVQTILDNSRPEFESKSLLLKKYIEYLSSHGRKDQAFLAAELPYLAKAISWYFKECLLRKDSRNAVYGLTDIFETAQKFQIPVDFEAAEKAFLVLSTAQITDDGTSSIAKSFFRWRLKKDSEVSLKNYIQLIESNSEHEQAEWILLFLLEIIVENSFQPRVDDFTAIWKILKSRLEAKLTEPASLAYRWFFESLVENYQSYSNGLEVVREISREFYDLCETLVDNPRLTLLLGSFKPLSAGLLEYPTTSQMLQLWHSLLLRVSAVEVDAFSRFTGRLYSLLETSGKPEELLDLDHTLLQFIESNPADALSPKFFWQLIKRSAFLPELAANVTNLITAHKNLEDSAPVLNRFFQFAGASLDHDDLIKCEASVIVALKENIWKPHADSCMQSFLPLCTRRVHYDSITDLFRAYLQTSKPQESITVIYRVMSAYHQYELDSEIDPATRRTGLEACLSIIEENAEREMAAKFLTVVLHTWEADLISRELVTRMLRTFIATIHPSRWRRILALLAELIRLFGSSSLLCTGITLESASAEINSLEQEGLISLRHRIEADI